MRESKGHWALWCLFFRLFFATRQRIGINRTANACRRRSVSVKKKSCSKSPQNSSKKSSFCPFCRLTYIILYAIIYPVRFFLPNITFFETTYGKIGALRAGATYTLTPPRHTVYQCAFLLFYDLFSSRRVNQNTYQRHIRPPTPQPKRKDRQHEKNRNRYGQ